MNATIIVVRPELIKSVFGHWADTLFLEISPGMDAMTELGLKKEIIESLK